MRTIKFRGKATFGKWLYGDLEHHPDGIYITQRVCGWAWLVAPDTIGQFTGLKDKNGVDIYEGDIIAVERELNFKREYVQHLAIEWKDYGNGMVGWSQFAPSDLWEVIGNIHDNPELLKEGAQ